MADFSVYQGRGEPDPDVDRIGLLAPAPPWRRFDGGPVTTVERDTSANQPAWLTRARSYQPDPETIRMVNAALHSRRPLLVSGPPGVGKSVLAHAVAYELRLGSVLRWPINSRSTLADALYRYDALARVEAASLAQRFRSDRSNLASRVRRSLQLRHIGQFVRLGPLGTALAPYEVPRVLLIDEIDKCDIDLPNDLLDVLEEGQFEIPELRRIVNDLAEVAVRRADDGPPVTVRGGWVRCRAFPLVILTSNGEREFPQAFRRRCVQLRMRPPEEGRLREIVAAHLGPEVLDRCGELIREFIDRRAQGTLATDQLLNAIYLLYQANGGGELTQPDVAAIMLRPLDDQP